MTRILLLLALLCLAGCGQSPTERERTEHREQNGIEQEAGSINCTIDVRNCEPGQRR